MIDNKSLEARRKFIETFSARVNDEVEGIHIAELRADSLSLKKMGLVLYGNSSGVWGMIVICKKSVYFYAPSHEISIMSLIRFQGDGSKIDEQIFRFDNCADLKFSMPPKKWHSFLSPEKLVFSFSIDGNSVQGELILQNNSAEILLKIKEILKQ